MEEKLQRVTLWLKKIYGNQPIPQYEVNATTVDILYDLAECNEARDRDVSLLIEDMKQKATEYEAEANYLQGLLAESLDLSLSSLSSEGTSYLNVLVNSAMTLETKDTSLASFFSAINDMTSELYATESKNREMELELTNIRKKLTAALMLEKQLEEDLKKTEEFLEVEKAKADSRSQNLKFLKDKSEDLKIRIKAAEEQLAATGLDQSLTHESLVSLSEPTGELPWNKFPATRRKLAARDLPPLFAIRIINGVDVLWTISCYMAACVLQLLDRVAQEILPSLCETNLLSDMSEQGEKKLAGLQEEIVPLKKKLESYLDLTPNPALAQVKIEEVKRELNALEAEFSKQIDMLTCEMPEPGKLQFT